MGVVYILVKAFRPIWVISDHLIVGLDVYQCTKIFLIRGTILSEISCLSIFFYALHGYMVHYYLSYDACFIMWHVHIMLSMLIF